MSNSNSKRQTPPAIVTASAFFFLLLCYHLIFSRFFPNSQGRLGHDYSGILPGLLDGYFWFKNNALLDVPWFSPSFCGGQPFFADVQSYYYSIPQVLTLFFNPLTSVYLSVLIFASLGFLGMYLLLQRVFRTSAETALLAASLFMFNGYYAHRMLVGHIGVQGFMLAPLVAFLLLQVAPPGEKKTNLPTVFNTVLAGFLVGYWLQSGLTSLIIPVSLAILAIVCLHFYTSKDWKVFLCRAVGATLIALTLSAAKLMVGFAFMANFARSDYLLPGVNGIFNALKLLFITLFFSPANIEDIAIPKLSNMQWMLSRHEWEYGITFIPLLIILVAWTKGLWAQNRSSLTGSKNHPAISLIALAMLAVILLLPLALNIYTPEWNAILKRTPLIQSSSALFRWWIIYIPISIVYAAVSLEKITFLERYRIPVVVVSIIVLLALNLTKDRLFYDTQGYDGNLILQAYQKSASSPAPPQIRGIGLSEYGNDVIAFGISQLACYNPSFGYRLEHLPFKSLHPGSIFAQNEGYLNLKNPACYVFPAENGCEPGDHFTTGQQPQAELFARYKPFPFKIPLRQKIANIISLSATAICLFFLIVSSCYGMVKKYFFDRHTE
ncbi:MAG: hypothetical protein A2520_09510 [Deltaproteobacteria bacterium RIFOXYD12_FULL_53_23]|nr:MAG: hypothetical protein A2520_09510 [Deltaproteobacteria bacterium RIFOXYD12_FULL_53_23]